LEQYDLIQFPYDTKFDEEQHDKIKEHVKRGGDIFDCHGAYTGEVMLGYRKGSVSVSNGLVYKEDWSIVHPRGDAGQECMANKDGKDYPWVVHNKYGKGEVIYCAGKIGLMSFTRGFFKANASELPYPDCEIKNRLWVDASGKGWREWIMELIKRGTEGNPLMEFENAPSGMIINAFKTERNIVINLLNSCGQKPERGFELPLTHNVTYPNLAERCGRFLKMKIRKRIKKATLISPDFADKVSIDTRYREPYTCIDIPADRINRYTVILLDEE
jgi:hypothetical protein